MTRAGRVVLVVWLAMVAGCHSSTPKAAPRPCQERSACGVGEYCAFKPGLCGKGKQPGVCRAAEPVCAAENAPVCGCDGQTYGSECAAHAAGVDLDVQGACKGPPPPHFMRCGAHYCDTQKSYCEIVLSDVFELPTDYTCKPLPAACVPGDGVARECGCFPQGTRCLSYCGHLPSGGGPQGFHLTCRL